MDIFVTKVELDTGLTHTLTTSTTERLQEQILFAFVNQNYVNE